MSDSEYDNNSESSDDETIGEKMVKNKRMKKPKSTGKKVKKGKFFMIFIIFVIN